MQQEDDLRGLAKTMDFMRALSILFVVINIYWFCYGQIREWGINIGVVDRILLNFDRTAGLFRNILWTKLFAVVFLALSCLGTKGVKEEKITWRKITASLATGGVLFFFNWWLLDLPLTAMANAAFYILTLSAGYICLLMGGVWMSRLLKNNLMDDPFNNENESFQQETRLIENEYSINLPTKFYYNKQWNNGFANVVNPQRAFARVYHTFQQCMWGVYLVLALVYVIWGEKLYGVRRRKAVMSHYADRRFKPATGFLLFFLPVMFFVAMIITIVSLMK